MANAQNPKRFKLSHDGGGGKDHEKTAAGEAQPHLPQEMKNLIWRELLRVTPGLQKTTISMLVLDCDKSTVTNSSSPQESQVMDPVPKSGYANLFELSIADVQPVFDNFLCEVAQSVTFSFESPTSLDNFAELLSICQSPEPAPYPRIRVALHLFHDNAKFRGLSVWRSQKLAHGLTEEAHDHVLEWMEAAHRLPHAIDIHVIMCRPWRDYRSLRGVTTSLRSPTGRNVDVGVDAAMLQGKGVPDNQLHLALTVASIKGLSLARQLSQTDVEMMVEHGCRDQKTVARRKAGV